MNLETPLRVYLLEQDIDTAQTIEKLCSEKSLMLESFSTPQELLSQPAASSPACVIVAQSNDQTFTVVEKLSLQEVEIPVIILGEPNDVYGAVKAIKAGAADYIEKPVIYGRLAEHFNQIANSNASSPSR